MFDFIPLSDYTMYFNYTILVMVLVAFWQCNTGISLQKNTATLNAMWGILFTILLILYMGLRPISGNYFGDTSNYAKGFYDMQHSGKPFEWQWEGEWLFYNLMNWFAKNVGDVHIFFLFCATIYTGCLWLAMLRIFKNYYYIPFLVILGMFTFWSYGVNGVRNGMGASVVILAMTYVNRIPVMLVLCFIATGIHKSCYLMIAAGALAWFIKNSYLYLVGWITSIGVSYAVGGRIQSFLAKYVSLGDDRFSSYLTGSGMIGEKLQIAMVFRWDFLLYSALGVFVGYYFVFRRNFKDEYYHWIYNTFLITNAFWVLVIRAIYSNRFAQLSWFIMPIVLIYPFMKQRFWQNHEKMLGAALLLFYAFSFYYNILK